MVGRRDMRGSPRAARRAAGFTLLEVLAAISVFLIGVVGVLGLLTAGTRMHQESQNLVVTNDVADEVLFLARRELAERAAAPGDASGAVPTPAPPAPVPSRPEFRYAWKVTPAPDVRLYLLTVDVTWIENGRERKTTFERVLSRLTSPAVDARGIVSGRAR